MSSPARWLVRHSLYGVWFSLAFLVLGGLGLWIGVGGTVVEAYQLHYDIILAVDSPFQANWSTPTVWFAVADAISAYLLVPALIGVALSRGQTQVEVEDELEGAVFSKALREIGKRRPTMPLDEKIGKARAISRAFVQQIDEI
jgi:hypothetical protein